MLIFIWMSVAFFLQFRDNKEIDNNYHKVTAFVIDQHSLTNSRTYTLEYYYNGKKHKGFSRRFGSKYRHKVGDSVCIEISTINPENIRFCEY